MERARAKCASTMVVVAVVSGVGGCLTEGGGSGTTFSHCMSVQSDSKRFASPTSGEEFAHLLLIKIFKLRLWVQTSVFVYLRADELDDRLRRCCCRKRRCRRSRRRRRRLLIIAMIQAQRTLSDER